ncbi:MAG: hypothetical protein ABDH18_05090 [Aquificaceae bacterium]
MPKLVLKNLRADSAEVVAGALSEHGISASKLLNEVFKGKSEVIIICPEQKLDAVMNSLSGLCTVEVLKEKEPKIDRITSLFFIGIVFDNALLFFLLKLSIYNEGMKAALLGVMKDMRAQTMFQHFLALIFIANYYFAMFFVKSVPPLSSLLGLEVKGDRVFIALAYCAVLPSLMLLAVGNNLMRFLGFVLISLTIGVGLYAGSSVKLEKRGWL